MVGKVRDEGVGGVEVGAVLNGVDGAEEDDEREGYEGGLSGIDADGHVEGVSCASSRHAHYTQASLT